MSETVDGGVGPSFVDEDILVLPESWRRLLHPRRGGVPVPPVGASPKAVQRARAHVLMAKPVLDALVDEAGEGGLSWRARRHLAGEADPAGAAVVALLAEYESTTARSVFNDFVDLWVGDYGLAFAACAVVELGSIELVRKNSAGEKGDGPWLETRLVATRNDRGTDVGLTAKRVRELLVASGEEEYAEAVERLAALRDTPVRRAAVSYLVPTQHDWVAQCCAEASSLYRRDIRTFQMVGAPDHLAALAEQAVLFWGEATVAVLATLLDGLGADALPVLTDSLDAAFLDPAGRKRVLEAIGLLPTDEAFQALLVRLRHRHVGPALRVMMNRFPARALRLLSGAAVSARNRGDAKAVLAMTDLLAGHLLVHPEALAGVEPGLPEENRAMIASSAGTTPRVPDAPVDALPLLLAEPPWRRIRKVVKPAVIAGLPVPDERSLHWKKGEREEWLRTPGAFWGSVPSDPTGWEAAVGEYHAGKWSPYGYWISDLLVAGPAESVRPIIADEGVRKHWSVEDLAWMKVIVARFEMDARALALTAARANPGACATLLLPYLDVEVAELAAGWLARVKKARKAAMAWFGRHGARAARLLIPGALGEVGPARRHAEEALLLIASREGHRAVVEAAREYGDRAVTAIVMLLAASPLDRLPATVPGVPGWAEPVTLPQVLLRDRQYALPATAVRHLLTMLAMSRPGAVYAGVDAVRRSCVPESLAEFSWGVFQQWERAGSPSKDGWALRQLGWLGDDETVRRLAPMIRAWPGDGGHHKAVNGLDVLADIGSDIALLHLNGIAEKSGFEGLKARARERIDEVADGLGLGAEQLADRLVPDLGLDADGSLTLDYGPRRFTVAFDAELKPFVLDGRGKLRKSLPKPGALDEEELATASRKRFTDLKKDVRTVAAAQVRRMETAMVERRGWTPAEFHTFFVEHPLVWHIARRLVWVAQERGGSLIGTFRIAEDRTFADPGDEVVEIPQDAVIRIAHPLDLEGKVAVWSQVFADYEILQPFPQLQRQVHVLSERERAAGRLERFEQITVPVHGVLALVGRGWERGVPLEGGLQRWISRRVPGGLHVVIGLHPGLDVAAVDGSGDQRLDAVWINDVPNDFRPRDQIRHTFSELDPLTTSEILADLTNLAASRAC
jgi:hypothetical protein